MDITKHAMPGPPPEDDRDPGSGALPVPEDDFDLDAHLDWLAGEIEAGRQRVPSESELLGPAMSISLGDAADVDPELLVALCGPEGLAGPGNPVLNEAFCDTFGQDRPADTLSPSPVLAALTEQAFAGLAGLTDSELTGALHAAIRLANRAFYLQTVAVAEFTRRRAEQLEAAKARKIPRSCRPGAFPDLELSGELLISRRHAASLMDEATELVTRLPHTLAGMAGGTVDPARATAIAAATLFLTDQDAAAADETLAADAAGIRADTLARRAAALAMKLDPDAVKRAKEEAKAARQRVEFGREFSGNARVSMREVDTADGMSVKASLDAVAVRLRNAGLAGTLDSLRTRAAMDLLLFRNPFDRLAPAPESPAEYSAEWPGPEDPGEWPELGDPGQWSGPGDPGPSPGPEDLEYDDPGPSASADPAGGDDEPDEGGVRYPSGPGTPAGGLAPMPAVVNLIVPAATLLGWGTAPGQAGSWGLTDPGETRDIVQAASNHPRSRWCVTVVNASGEAIAHACARGRHPWTPQTRQPPDPPPDPTDQPARMQALLRHLGITPAAIEPIARGSCDHRHAEDRYTPSRKLKHLIRARAQTCTAPGCAAQSFHADQDHVTPYPEGQTDECNLHAPCRAHHRAKQAPGWRVEEPEPGVLRWTLPNGRTHVTRPTVYST